MKRCFVLFLLLLLIACSEDPANITEEPGDSSAAPNLEVQTVQVKLLSDSFLLDDSLRKRRFEFRNPPALLLPGDIKWEWNQSGPIEPPAYPMFTEVGVPTEVYRVRDGHLIHEEIVSQESLYHLVWCQLEDKIVLMNVLANRIRYIPYDEAMDTAYDNLTEAQEKRFDEIKAEEQAKLEDWRKNNPNKAIPDEIFYNAERRWHQEINPQPFDIRHHTGDFGDTIEVIIKYRFTLEVIRRNLAGHPWHYPPVEMIFVDVKQNISRPHITFRGELFQ